MDRIRVASLQYFIRPVQTFEEFRDQVQALAETAADYKAHLLVFPEYFSVQLLTLGDIKRPMREQIRTLARQTPRFLTLMQELARANQLYIIAGTIPTMENASDQVCNDCYIFTPAGNYGVQGKLHMTRFEVEEWDVPARSRLRIFETDFGRLAIAICHDVEFPEIARTAAREGANILIVPTCTDEQQGYLRVRYCAQARTIENHLYVIQACTVGSLPMVPAVSLNYGQACILTPSDFPFARDGILAEGHPNQEMMVIGDLNMETIRQTRTFGTVLPLKDDKRSAKISDSPEIIRL